MVRKIMPLPIPQTIGSLGSQIYPGQPDLSELHPELRDPTRKYRIFREMLDNDPAISRIRSDFAYLLLAGSWTIEGDDQAVELVKAAISAMAPIRLSDVVVDLVQALWWGWSWSEITYQRSGGRWLWKSIERRPQWTMYGWTKNQDGTYDLMQFIQVPDPGQRAGIVRIPAQKSIHLTLGQGTGGPEGDGVLRHVYTPYRDARDIGTSLKIGQRMSLEGVKLLQMPAEIIGADDGSAEALIRDQVIATLAQIERGERTAICLPGPDATGQTAWKLEIIKGGGGTDAATGIDLYDRKRQELLIGLWAAFLSLGQAGASGGSKALSGDQTDILRQVVAGVASAICDVFTAQAIQPLCAVNGIPAGAVLRWTPNKDLNLGAYMSALKTAVEAGFITHQPADETKIREQMHLPPLEKSLE